MEREEIKNTLLEKLGEFFRTDIEHLEDDAVLCVYVSYDEKSITVTDPKIPLIKIRTKGKATETLFCKGDIDGLCVKIEKYINSKHLNELWN